LLFVWNVSYCFVLLGLCLRNYRDKTLIVPAFTELNGSINKSVKSVILTHGHIAARIVL